MDYGINKNLLFESTSSFPNETVIPPKGLNTHASHQCGEIYSRRKWENQASCIADGSLQAKRNKVMRRRTTFVFHHTSHPWSRSRILIWMMIFMLNYIFCIFLNQDEITVASGTLSRSSSMESLNQVTITSSEQAEAILGTSNPNQGEFSSRVAEYLSESISINTSQPLAIDEEDNEGIAEEGKVDTLYELFQKT